MKGKVFLILFLFFLVHSTFILYHNHNIISDDFTYFYYGKLLAEGNMIYKDFFSAHPPLQMMIYSFFIILFGINLWIVNLVPLVAILISSYLAYRITNKLWVMVLFLTIFPIFHLSTIGFGLNLGLMFIMLSLYFSDKRPMLAGVLAGCAVLTRLHFLPIVIGMLFVSNRPRTRAKYILGGVVIGFVFVTLFIFFPQAINQIFFYHALKQYHYWIIMRYFVLGIGLVGCFVSFRTRYFFPFVLYFIFSMSLKTVYAYYAIPMGALFALALAEKDIYKWKYLLIASSMVGLSLGATIISNLDIVENKPKVSSIIETVKEIDNPLVCGNNEVVPLIALKTNKTIKDNEVDTNFQRRKKLNCSGAIAVYRLRNFENCKLLNYFDDYKVSLC